MSDSTETISSELLCDVIVKGIEELKGERITILDLREVESAVCDFFVICEGSSDTQIKSIANSIVKETRNNISERPWHIEGMENCEWVLIDYANVVVHIFIKEKREFFSLEDLWADAKITQLDSAQ
ncbi:MAG: ribosome silencing factor [Crocinitomicaceae bacterium]|nr:ribosome silencing factor [Crocinitomicaceae bacterium]|tara:strand:+ start:2225 stop:2602 length:378 start_codon:yes stop_codon:yes gene_type:complete